MDGIAHIGIIDSGIFKEHEKQNAHEIAQLNIELAKKLKIATEALEKICLNETFHSPVANMEMIIAREALENINGSR